MAKYRYVFMIFITLLEPVAAASAGRTKQISIDRIHGLVLSTSGPPAGPAKVQIEATLPDAALSLLRRGKVVARGRADAGGEFELGGVPVGSYTLVVEAHGFKTLHHQVRVVARRDDADTYLQVLLCRLEQPCDGGVTIGPVVAPMHLRAYAAAQLAVAPEPAHTSALGSSSASAPAR